MNGLSVIITIVVLSLIAPFVLRIHRSSLVWITLGIVNLIIISLFVVVRDSSPQKLNAAHSASSVAESTTETQAAAEAAK